MKELKIGLILSATDRMSKVIDSAVSRSAARIRLLGSQAGKSSGLIARTSSSLKDAITSLPFGHFLTNPIVAIAAATAGITKLGIANDTAKVSFEALLGSENKALKLMAEMRKYADVTPFEKQDLYDASKTMIGFGVEENKVMNSMKMLGDVSMGNKERFKSLALAYSQVTAAGRLQGQDLLQLVNAGYNPLRDISEMTGVSMRKLRDVMRQGGISAKLVEKALKHATGEGGKFHNMTIRIGQTVGGKVSTAIDSFKNLMLELYEVLRPILLPALDLIINVLNGLLPVFKTLAGYMKSLTGFISSLINKIKEGNPIIITVVGTLASILLVAKSTSIAIFGITMAMKILIPILKAARFVVLMFNAVLAISPMGWIAIAIVGVSIALVACWHKFAKFRAVILTVWDTVKGFGGILKNFVIDRITGIISGLGSIGNALSELFKGNFSKSLEIAKKGIKDLSGYTAWSNAYTGSKTIVSNISNTYSSNLAKETPTTVSKKIANTKTSINNNQRVVYSPQITINGSSKDKEEFSKMLREHSYDIGNIVNNIERNKLRLKF